MLVDNIRVKASQLSDQFPTHFDVVAVSRINHRNEYSICTHCYFEGSAVSEKIKAEFKSVLIIFSGEIIQNALCPPEYFTPSYMCNLDLPTITTIGTQDASSQNDLRKCGIVSEATPLR
jgi:hypothetical protein